jgi:glycosyltransferase involved in cell wall biosynthesis
MAHPRFVVNICHSNYTRAVYERLGVDPAKLVCIHNGFEPERFRERLLSREAKRSIGIDPDTKTVVYTGRINHKKGLEVVVRAARRLPGIRFLLVGATGQGELENEARAVSNIQLVPWQSEEALGRYIQAADVLLIPPSSRPLAEFGSTVLPLKLFLYLAAERPIVAGTTPDIRELLRHEDNALLCAPDDDAALAATLDRLLSDASLALRLARAAASASRALTWDSRAERIVRQIEERLPAVDMTRQPWSPELQAKWLRRSSQWLAHLVRTRSWVLPPASLDMGAELGQ